MNVVTNGAPEAARDALQQADEAFLLARRRLANRIDSDIDGILERLDAKIDEALTFARDGDLDLAERNLLGVKLLMRKLAGIQHANERDEIEAYLSVARDAMDEAVRQIDSVICSAEYGAMAERALRKAAPSVKTPHSVVTDPTDPIPRKRMSRFAWIVAFVAIVFCLILLSGCGDSQAAKAKADAAAQYNALIDDRRTLETVIALSEQNTTSAKATLETMRRFSDGSDGVETEIAKMEVDILAMENDIRDNRTLLKKIDDEIAKLEFAKP